MRADRELAQHLLLVLIASADERVSDRMDGKGDSVLYADLPHQFGNMRLHRALLDLEGLPDLTVGTTCDQQLQNLFLSVGKVDASSGEDLARS